LDRNNYESKVTMTVSEIAQVLRGGRSSAYLLVRQAYEDMDNFFDTKKIGKQYRAITSSFFDWLKSEKK
jgi:hypothetical protein